MLRKEPERGGGRRPLLAAFVGNNRQMLNDIRDSLSHLLKSQQEADGECDLSQNAPNLAVVADKCLVPGGPKKGLENHTKALAEIREALRPFQTSRDQNQGASNGVITRQKVQQIMAFGIEEDMAVGILKLCNSVEGAVKLLNTLAERYNGANKLSPGVSKYPVNRKPSFESKYGGSSSPAASETSSIRSGSPSLSNVPVSALQTLANGHQTPPPLPPRAPISPHCAPPAQARGHTPPPSGQGDGGGAIANGIGAQALSDVPQGHVQQLIKRMSPAQFGSPVVQNHSTCPSQRPVSSGGSLNVQQAVAVSGPAGRQAVVASHPHTAAAGAGRTQTVTGALAQKLQQGLVMTHQSVASSLAAASTSSTPVPSAPRLTINISHPPPPPYSQAQVQAQARGGTPTLVPVQGEQSHYLGSQLTDYHYLVAAPDSPLNLSTASSSSAATHSDNNMTNHAMMNGGQLAGFVGSKLGPALPVVASRCPMAPHTPIIMHSVKSKQVHKPVPQTATGPMSPAPHLATPVHHNYISQVQTKVNMSVGNGQIPNAVARVAAASTATTTTTTAHARNLPIHVAGQAPHHVVHSHLVNGPQYATEPLPPHAASCGQATIHIPLSTGPAAAHPYPNHVHLQNFGSANYDLYHRLHSETMSTPRSDSPVSRTTNQSPLSVLSTTSSLSTNSDIPDKPPPPYPYSTHKQPPLPPRVPLQKPPPPPPAGMYGMAADQSSRIALSSQWCYLSAGQTAVSNYPGPPPLPATAHNGLAVGHSETASEQGDDTDTETVSSLETGTASGGGEKHRCMSPIPQRKPDAWERDKLNHDTKVRNYSPQAFKFFMEQHVENVLKIHQQRLMRRTQLEHEMAKAKLSEEAAHQMRRMLHQKESNYLRLKRAKMEKSMFDKIKTLGVGAFGEVSLCRKKDTGMLFAMKTLQKSDVLKRNQVAHVKAERDILAEADNEWVVKLYYSFQDCNYLYFVMDYVPGGDLMGLLIRLEILDETLSRFYVAELVQAIESVHRMGFIHRDIKPDNILIDRNGHIKLTDFGLCTGFRWTHNSKYYQGEGTHARQDSMEVGCQLDEQCHCEILKPLERRRKREKRCLAHSLVGTPNYIAPEVLLRSAGYTCVCDWWSVGVILFEMLVGHPPFYASSPVETQYKVINWKETLEIPQESNLSQPAKDLIVRLCCGPEDRLGLNGAGEIKDHPFFDGINLETLRKQVSPYIPNIRYATDTSNFDPVDPDKLLNSDSEENKKVEKLQNGKHPEHAFFEFTFRRFFDDGGYPMVSTVEEPPDSSSPVYV